MRRPTNLSANKKSKKPPSNASEAVFCFPNFFPAPGNTNFRTYFPNFFPDENCDWASV